MQAANSETLREQLTRVNAELRAAGRPDSFYSSLEAAWNRYGSLTERQEAALVRSFAQREERAAARAQEAAPTSPIPTGRVTISGEIVSTKWQDNRFGGAWKMLVKSEAGWKVYGTVPASLDAENIKGHRVTFTATIEPKEAAFGFFSRPTNATCTNTPRFLGEEAPAAPVAAGAAAFDQAAAAKVPSVLSDIIARAKALEALDAKRDRAERAWNTPCDSGNSRAERAAAWDTDSMSEAA